MRTLFFILVLLHGLIHLLGFVKGFDIKEVKELSLPISKSMGFIWLTAATLLLVYGVLYFANTKYAWLLGFIAVVVSQIIIFQFWKDAKFGTLPNIVILIVSAISYGHFKFNNLLQEETNRILNQGKISSKKILSENDIHGLPISVKNWLRHSGIIGKPSITIGMVRQQAEMKLKPEQENWYNASAIQYSTIDTPGFIWTVDVKMNRLINFQGRDKFEDGKGEMLIKLHSLINIVHEKGEKLSESTIQRYLGEMVWFPSLALSPYISWQEVNATTAIATMDYKGTKGSGTFYFNLEGDFIKFSAMRFKDNGPGAKRYEWVLLVTQHNIFDGIRVPSKMTATWKLDNKDWTWLKLEIKDIKYNENASR